MESVDHPDHYGGADNPYEVIKVLEAWLTPDEYIGFLKGNSIKYLARHRQKGGDEDLRKSDWYSTELARFVGSRQSAVGSRQSAVGSRQSAVASLTPVRSEGVKSED